MSPVLGFVLALAFTLMFLGQAVLAARRHRVRRHVTFVGGALAALGVTIWFALELGRIYDLSTAGAITPIHLMLAKITTAAYVLPIVAGWRTLQRPRMRPLHKGLAYIVLALTALSAVTGTIMILRAQPYAD